MTARSVKTFCALFVVFVAGTGSVLHAQKYPAYYNLIEPDPQNPDIICITPVRDQGSLGSCWANATTSAFESSILKHGLVERADDHRLDLSCWHLVTHASYKTPAFTTTWDSVHEVEDYDRWGGNPRDAISYWTRGRGDWPVPGANSDYRAGGGPVLGSTDPLNEYPLEAGHNKEDLRPYVPPADEPLAWRLEWSNRLLFDHPGPPTAAERNQIKDQLMDTSAVVTDMFAEFSDYFDGDTATYLYRGKADTDHEVLIVGWDDTIRVPGAKHRGAWLVQNSWGEDTERGIHEDYRGIPEGYMRGCFWLSYDDTAAAKDNFSFIAVPLAPYSETVLENQIFDDDMTVGSAPGERDKALSVLKCQAPVHLGAVGVMAQGGTNDVSVRVYDNLEDAKRDDDRTGLLGSAQETLSNDGYATIYFKDWIAINTDTFYVVLDFGPTEKAAIGVDSRSPRENGISYVWRNNEWLDLNDNGDHSGIVFLKGLVWNNEKN